VTAGPAIVGAVVAGPAAADVAAIGAGVLEDVGVIVDTAVAVVAAVSDVAAVAATVSGVAPDVPGPLDVSRVHIAPRLLVLHSPHLPTVLVAPHAPHALALVSQFPCAVVVAAAEHR
jgi:hypothetical protein